MIWECRGITFNCSSSTVLIGGYKCPKDCNGQCDICLKPFKNTTLEKDKYNAEENKNV